MGEPQDKVVFEQSFEALFVRALRHKMRPRFADRLKKAGIDVDGKLMPAYPFEVWREGLSIAAEEAFPKDPPEKAMFKLGELFIDGYRDTFMGQALFPLLLLLGPKRALQQAARSFRTGNNYTETELTEISPGCFELWMNAANHPMFVAGILNAALEAAGVKSGAVEVLSHTGGDCTFRITWNEPGS